jgi:hypothetical protein
MENENMRSTIGTARQKSAIGCSQLCSKGESYGHSAVYEFETTDGNKSNGYVTEGS